MILQILVMTNSCPRFDDIKLEIIEDKTQQTPGNLYKTSLATSIISPIDIVNTLKTAWDIIADSKPQVKIDDGNAANAMPKGSDSDSLTGWQPLPSEIKLHHSLGIDNSYVDFTLSWFFNGQYIKDARVLVDACAIIGHSLNVSISFNDPLNIGTATFPLAELPLNIMITYSTIFKSITKTLSGVIDGSGKFASAEIKPSNVTNI